jgi:hypothetical protein
LEISKLKSLFDWNERIGDRGGVRSYLVAGGFSSNHLFRYKRPGVLGIKGFKGIKGIGGGMKDPSTG